MLFSPVKAEMNPSVPEEVDPMKVYVFKSLPPFLWEDTRDLRAMWALEEGGISYEPIGRDADLFRSLSLQGDALCGRPFPGTTKDR